MAVARSGKVEAAKRLLEAGADVNAKESFGGQTALMWAAAQSQPEMVKLLASKGRRPQRARRHPSMGAQDHHRAASEGHEQGRLHAIAVCGA
jgi:ankyrin repeat protein